MIVLDSSAVIAMLELEPESDRFFALLDAADKAVISAVSVLECSLLSYSRHGDKGLEKLNDFLVRSKLVIESFDEHVLAAAVDAFKRYGKGRHRAALNFGDCASYALARLRDAPLLFKGDDFARTDVKKT